MFAISIDPNKYKSDFLSELFWGTFYQQHLEEQYCGLSTYNSKRSNEKIRIRTHRGHFRDTFSNDMLGLEGTEGIGYCGHTREPFLEDSRLGEFSACFSGNIINRVDLVERFKSFGHTLARGGDDIEVIVKLIAQGNDVIDGIKKMTNEIRGSYVLFLLTEEGIYVVCSPDGRWSLVIGGKEGATIVATESGGFSNLRFAGPTLFSESGFKIIRDLAPGEIGLLRNGRFETKDTMKSELIQICSFLWVYTSFPNALIKGIPASVVRKRMGATLARQDIKNGLMPDVVAPVPDSGRFHAIGYYQEFVRQINEGRISEIPFYDEALLKYPYAGRSFTPSEKTIRDLEAFVKILPSGESYAGKILVVVDDSIVRGTQTQTNLIPKLWRLGFKEIHLRISNPELLSHCPWGKTTKRGETLASSKPSMTDRVNFLGITSLAYNTIDGLMEAVGLPREKLCVDCSLLEKSLRLI